ncbi:circadian clock-controlled protein daywake-like [Plodia interpunctella]|uniref:circadian clock-controlled protein daywake-like n=1 Tax=Plodia interpunctella TaxID=58824 RepID=UPI00236886D9|nr:circadian clock-controlled protein daywake-like [Plodia interpunctella]
MATLNFVPIFVLLISFCRGSLGRFAPDYIHNCPNMTSECLKKTIQETIPYFIQGIPEFGISPLDPLVKDHIAIDLPGLKVELFNGRITGIRKCIVDNVKYENKHADINLHCRLVVKGTYRAHGNILIMQIDGEGDAKLKVSNVTLSAKINFEDVVRDGTVYHEIQDISIQHKFVDRVVFDLANLFKGSPEISEIVLQFLNDNWKLVVDEFGDPIVKTVVDFVVDNIRKFFSSIPKDEIIVFTK